MDITNPIVQAVIVIVVVVGSMIFTTMFSGWDELCNTYPVQQEYTGRWVNLITIKFSAVWHIDSCISVAFAPEGLYLKWGFLNTFAKRMQIPWSAVQAIREQSMVMYSNIQIELTTGQVFGLGYNAALKEYVAQQIPALGLSKIYNNDGFIG